MPKPAVIVVNSQVARGSVGGRASLFVLERLGFPVWFVPSVQLPWHPGHGPGTRILPDSETFAALLADLAAAPWLGEVGAVLTGYLGAAAQVGPVARLVAAVKARNPDAAYLCDPVIGDDRGLYVPEPLAAAMRDDLLPLADIVTPNRHELLWHTGSAASDNAGLRAAAGRLDAREVVVTSAFAPEGMIGTLLVADGATRLATHRALSGAPNGTGDLFAARYLAARLSGEAPVKALHRSASVTLSLVELAARLGTDEIPLTAGRDGVDAAPANVIIAPLEGI